MIYLIYKTTNLINKKIYIGVHAQKNSDFDGYLGSGTKIVNSYKKYGKENFIRETLYEVDNEELAYFIEEMLVTPEFIDKEYTYNIIPGGTGNPVNLNSIESIRKRTKTYIERGLANCKHMMTSEALDKAKDTRKLNGTDQCKHMNNPEVQKLAVERSREAVIRNSHIKYPDLNLKVKYYNKYDLQIFEGTMYELSMCIYGKGMAVANHGRLVKLLESGKPFMKGVNTGNYIKLNECSTTIL